MSDNSNLNGAKKQKYDEFYTRYLDIAEEMSHYGRHFAGKVVYCNCDDPYRSNFFRYFADNFNRLGLRKLIATGFCFGRDSEGVLVRKPYADVCCVDEVITELPRELSSDLYVDRLMMMPKNVCLHFFGDADFSAGDFRSRESVSFLGLSDIVVTNPPFSLFREFVDLLVRHDKKFLVLGNKNAVTYKSFFPYFKDDRVWFGYRDAKVFVDGDGGLRKFGNIGWYTNLDTDRRHALLPLEKTYSPQEYSKYDGFDAINVDRTKDIPKDYDGIMGVPISFLDRYNPEQFEIVGVINHGTDGDWDLCKCVVGGREVYKRIAVRRRK